MSKMLKISEKAKTKLRVVVLISGSGSNLQALIDGMQAGELSIEIVAVISNREDAYGLERARNANIPAHALSHTHFNSRDEFDFNLAELIQPFKPGLIVLAGFMRILTAQFVEQFANKLINIHPSLLPKFTGVNTHQRAIDAGETHHGASVHFVITELDAGPVIIQGQVKLNASETAKSLQQRIHKIEHIIYPKAVQWIAENRVSINNGKVLLDGHTSNKQTLSVDC